MFQTPDGHSPDDAGRAGGREFWALPGVDAPAAGAVQPGQAPVGAYSPDPSPEARELIGALEGLQDVGDLVAVAHAAATRLGARLTGGEPTAGWRPEVLDQIVGLVESGNAVQAATRELVAQADRSGVASARTRTGSSTWLGLKCNLTRGQVADLVLGARKADRFKVLRKAAAGGAVNRWQVQAVAGVLGDLAGVLGAREAAAAEASLVGKAVSMASDQLARQAEVLLEEVAPEVAQQTAEERARRQLARAESKQFFKLSDNHDGTASLKGLLPIAEGERLRAVVDKVAEKARREQAHAPDGRLIDRGQARAAALVEIAKHVQGCGHAQPLGAAPARLVVTVKAEDLIGTGAGSQIGAASQSGPGSRVGDGESGPGSRVGNGESGLGARDDAVAWPAGNRGAGSGRDAGPSDLAGAEPGGPVDAEAGASGVFGARLGWGGDAVDSRAFARLACDCEAVRVVLGARSQVLDVGRATRVIPAGLRIALAARDKGCCFPGCDRPPEVCEGHHVLPWQRGGTTCLSNICLLCPAHHRLVEPPRNGPPGWQARLREDGLWEFVPPAQFDPERKPILHQRFQQPGPSR